MSESHPHLYGWECPCGEYYNPETLEFCAECGLFRGSTEKYKVFGYWKSLALDLRRLVRTGDPEAEVHTMMTGDAERLPEAVKAIEGVEVRSLGTIGNIFILTCRVKHLVAVAKLPATTYIEEPKIYRFE
jgi:hypothetical protein